ncbi:MAG: GAF domain-containing protein [Pseudomonadota bacterium]
MRKDPERLEKLRQLAILDTAPEVVYDDIVRALADSFDVPIAMVNILDGDRDWFKSCVGLPFSESPATTSFCQAFFQSSKDVIVAEDTARDGLFAAHPLVLGEPFVRFYAATRLVVDGQTMGTLCVYDVKPKRVTDEQRAMLELLGRAAMEKLGQRSPAAASSSPAKT